MEEMFDKELRGHHRHHHHHGLRHRPFSPEEEEKFLEEADLNVLLLRAAHETQLRNARLGISQDKILKILAENKTMSQHELRQRMHVRPGSFSEIVSKLEEKGLLSRERSEEDRRNCTLTISEEGEKLAAVIDPEKLEKLLPENEENELKELLKKLIRAARPK